jgi:hypothetical protein
MNKFCDFCSCEDCQFGRKNLTHAETSDYKYICDACYYYDLCIDGGCAAPCQDKECQHRPKLISPFVKFNG